MKPILLQFVHPALEKSRVHRRLLARASTMGDVRVNDLYQVYPDFHIDVPREKGLLESHDSVVFQFPLYWYSSPPLLKEWFDLVLEYGWAYGAGAEALVGKQARLAVTTGGSADSYSRSGHNGFTMEEMLRPILQTFKVCGMRVGKPFFVHDALHIKEAAAEEMLERYEAWLLED